jgi:integrase/recombinase XerD
LDVDVTIAEFKRQLKAQDYAENSIITYGWALDGFRGYLQTLKITDLRKVTHQIVINYQAELMTKSFAMETKALKIRVVKRLFEYLEDNHQLLINPTEGIVESNRKNRKIGPVLSIEEMQRLLNQPNLSFATQLRDKAAMEVLYSTGIRSNELLSLQVYDVDLKDEVLFIRKGKGKKQRVVPLGKNAVRYLREYLEKIRPRHGRKNPKERLLFLTDEGNPLTWDTIRTKINDYRHKAGLKRPVGLHIFRRSCATHMLQQGADIRYIQKLLGHKHLKTTQLYTKVRPVDLKKTHDKTHPNKEVRGQGSGTRDQKTKDKGKKNDED